VWRNVNREAVRYVDKHGNVLPSYDHLKVAMLLDLLGVRYSVKTRGEQVVLETDNGAVLPGMLGAEPLDRMAKVIEISDSSLNFDYAHFLPDSPKCSVLHGHSSRVTVEVAGYPVDDMVVEFGEAKRIVKGVLNELDHKLIVCGRYVEKLRGGRVKVRFVGKDGEYELIIPENSTYIIDGESTVENISSHIAGRIAERIRRNNILYVKVRMSEGFGKAASSHTWAME